MPRRYEAMAEPVVAFPAAALSASALPVTPSENVISPVRCESLGTRCCCARRMSAPHLSVWLPFSLVQLFIHCTWFSVCLNGQLNLLTTSDFPKSKPLLVCT